MTNNNQAPPNHYTDSILLVVTHRATDETTVHTIPARYLATRGECARVLRAVRNGYRSAGYRTAVYPCPAGRSFDSETDIGAMMDDCLIRSAVSA